ncbi:MAG: protein kinase [Kofleriaceae bacterium]
MIGETIGNFRVISRLGRGGMGEVFLGEHISIQTRVAIKVLHPSISSDVDQVQRFFNEARVVARIRHSGVVKIFDVGFHADSAYLVMELLEGELLSHRIARRPLSMAEISDLGRQIASTLAATHASGVIHRDLKPDNIFIVVDEDLPGRERVKVLDFGVAKLGGTLAGANPKTIGLFGTPCYMAPEQFGDASNIDWRADAYALGCVAFEMACGQPPFEVKTVADAFFQHTQAQPATPSTIASHLTPAFDQLIARLLAKHPAQRPESMREIVDAFQALAGGEQISRMAVEPRRRTKEVPEQATTLQLGAGEVRGRLGRRLLFGGSVAALAAGAVLAIGIGSQRLQGAALAEPAAQPIHAAAPPSASPRAPTAVPPRAPTVVIQPVGMPAPSPAHAPPEPPHAGGSPMIDAGVADLAIEHAADAGVSSQVEPSIEREPAPPTADEASNIAPDPEPAKLTRKPERSQPARTKPDRRSMKRGATRRAKPAAPRDERSAEPGVEITEPTDILDNRE